MKRCSLCGGKLVNNICTECGLDNSKSDANYSTTKDHHYGEQLTHTHEAGESVFAGKTMTKEERQQLRNEQMAKPAYSYRKDQGNRSAQKKTTNKNNPIGKLISFITFMLIFFSIFSSCIASILD